MPKISPKTTSVAPRRRRTADEARRLILEAAERRLVRGGPESIRLQDIAADVGVSHPAVLHHFGSREGLLTALAEHGLRGLQTQILAGWPSSKVPDIAGTFERFFEVAEERGYARLIAWLILSGREGAARSGMMRAAAERMHAGHQRARQRAGRQPPRFEESLFISVFVSVVVFGEALYGPFVRRSLGLRDDAATIHRFRTWLAGMSASPPVSGRRRRR